jgi:hypothetical protein
VDSSSTSSPETCHSAVSWPCVNHAVDRPHTVRDIVDNPVCNLGRRRPAGAAATPHPIRAWSHKRLKKIGCARRARGRGWASHNCHIFCEETTIACSRGRAALGCPAGGTRRELKPCQREMVHTRSSRSALSLATGLLGWEGRDCHASKGSINGRRGFRTNRKCPARFQRSAASRSGCRNHATNAARCASGRLGNLAASDRSNTRHGVRSDGRLAIPREWGSYYRLYRGLEHSQLDSPITAC